MLRSHDYDLILLLIDHFEKNKNCYFRYVYDANVFRNFLWKFVENFLETMLRWCFVENFRRTIIMNTIDYALVELKYQNSISIVYEYFMIFYSRHVHYDVVFFQRCHQTSQLVDVIAQNKFDLSHFCETINFIVVDHDEIDEFCQNHREYFVKFDEIDVYEIWCENFRINYKKCSLLFFKTQNYDIEVELIFIAWDNCTNI